MALLSLAPLTAQASGSFVPSSERARPAIDRELYELGKAICRGEAALAEVNPALADAPREDLQALHGRLPAAIRARLDLESKAGRLSDHQMEALLHFIRVRFRVRLQ